MAKVEPVFLSYSNVDSDAVSGIADFLVGKSFSVWRDQESLYAGQRWPKALGEALDASQAILLVWSQNSAKSEFVEMEWCTAIALRKTIIPFIIDDAELPPSLSAVHFIDGRRRSAYQSIIDSLATTGPPMRHGLAKQVIEKLDSIRATEPHVVIKTARSIFVRENWNVAVNVSVDERDISVIFEGISTHSPDFAIRVNRFVDEYLGTEEQPVPFGGRQQDLDFLDSWLSDDKMPQRLFMGAPAGRGKSALLTHWSRRVVSTRPDTHVIFFPVSIRFNTNLASVVFPTLAARLAAIYGENLPGSVDTPAEVWRAAVANFLNRAPPDGKKLLLIIDGIDEAADWEMGPDLFPYTLPSSTHVVLSARLLAGDVDGSAWLERFGWSQHHHATTFSLNPLSHTGVSDVLSNIAFPAHRLAGRVDFVAELHRLSEGDPLLVRLYVEDLWARGEAAVRLTPEDLCEIEAGLEGFFTRWWEDQRKLWGETSPLREASVRTLLDIFSCALGPLTQDDMGHLFSEPAGLNAWTLEDGMRPISRFVIGDGKQQGYAFSHPRLAYFFYDKLQFAGQAKKQETLFVDWGRASISGDNDATNDGSSISAYLVQYYRIHLERTECSLDEFKPLVSRKWMVAWSQFDKGTYFGFLADVHKVWSRTRTVNMQAVAAGKPAPEIATEIRCALCQSSVSSLAGKIPIDVVTELIERESWSVSQALAYCTQIVDVRLRLETLLHIHSKASEQHHPIIATQFLSTIQDEKNSESKKRLLLSLSEQALPQYVYAALLDEIRSIDDATIRTRLLIKAANQFWGDRSFGMLVDEILESCDGIKNRRYRAQLITELARQTEEPRRSRALDQVVADVNSLGDMYERRLVLEESFKLLNEDQKQQVVQNAIAAINAIEDLDDRLYAKSQLGRYGKYSLTLPTPKPLPRPSNVQQTTESPSAPPVRALARKQIRIQATTRSLGTAITDSELGARAIFLSSRVSELGQNISGDRRLAKVLESLVWYMSDTQRDAARAVADKIGDPVERANVLIACAASSSDDTIKSTVAAALRRIGNVDDPNMRARMCWEFICLLPEEHRGLVLAALVDHLARSFGELGYEKTVSLFPYRQTSTPKLSGNHKLAQNGFRAWRELYAQPLVVAALNRALEFRYFGDVESEIDAWLLLADRLPEASATVARANAAAAADQIDDPASRIRILCEIGTTLSGRSRAELLAEARQTVDAENDASVRHELLWLLAKYMPEPEEDDELVDLVTDHIEREMGPSRGPTEDTIRDLAHNHQFRLVKVALEKFSGTDEPARSFIRFARYAPEDRMEEPVYEALLTARSLPQTDSIDEVRQEALPLIDRLVAPSVDVQREALYALSALPTEGQWSRNIRMLARIIDESLIGQLLTLAWNSGEIGDDVYVVQTLANRYTNELFSALALETVSEVPSELKRRYALSSIAPYLGTTAQWDDAIRLAREIGDRPIRALALAQLALAAPKEDRLAVIIEALRNVERMSIDKDTGVHLLAIAGQIGSTDEQVLELSLTTALNIVDKDERASAVGRLAKHLNTELLERAAAAFHEVGDFADRGRTLHRLSCQCPLGLRDKKLNKAVTVASQSNDVKARALVLAELGASSPAEKKRAVFLEALESADQIGSERQRSESLRTIALLMIEGDEVVFKKLLDALAALQEGASTSVLTTLAPHVPQSLLPQLLRLVAECCNHDRAIEIFLNVAPRLSELQLDNALDEYGQHLSSAFFCRGAYVYSDRFNGRLGYYAARNRSGSFNARAIVFLTGYCGIDGYNEFLKYGLGFTHEQPDRIAELPSLGIGGFDLPGGVRASIATEGLKRIGKVEDDAIRASALVFLVPLLSPRDLETAWSLVEQIENPVSRAQVVALIAPLVPDTLHTLALSTIRALSSPYARFCALRLLLEHAAGADRKVLSSECLSAACAVVDDPDKAEALAQLAPFLDADLQLDLIDATEGIAEESYRVFAIKQVAEHLDTAHIGRVLSIAESLSDENLRATLLGQLMRLIPDFLAERALAIVNSFRYSGCRAQALVALTPILPESLHPEALRIAKSLTRVTDRADCDAALVPVLSNTLRETAVHEALVNLRLVVGHEYRCNLLKKISPYLSPHSHEDALEVAMAIDEECVKAECIDELLVPLAAKMPDKIYSAINSLEDEYYRAILLAELSELLPEPDSQDALRASLDAVARIPGRNSRSDTLLEIVDVMEAPSQEVVSAALTAAFKIPSDNYRATALETIALRLSPERAGEALSAAIEIQKESERVRALSAILDVAIISHGEALLQSICSTSSERLRSELFRQVAQIGDQALRSQVLAETRRIRSTVYRGDVLVDIILGSDRGERQESINELLAIERESSRALALTAIMADLDEDEQLTVIQAISSFRNEGEQVALLDDAGPLRGNALDVALTVARGIRDDYCRAMALACVAGNAVSETSAVIRPEIEEALRKLEPGVACGRVLLRLNADQYWRDREPETRIRAEESGESPPDLIATELTPRDKPDTGEIRDEIKIARKILLQASPPGGKRSASFDVHKKIARAAALEAEGDRALVIQQIAPSLTEEQIPDVLGIVADMRMDTSRAQAIIGLMPFLKSDHIAEALIESLAIEDNELRASVLEESVSRVKAVEDRTRKYEIVCSLVSGFCKSRRCDLLGVISAYAPIIEELGGEQAVASSISAVEDSGIWWP